MLKQSGLHKLVFLKKFKDYLLLQTNGRIWNKIQIWVVRSDPDQSMQFGSRSATQPNIMRNLCLWWTKHPIMPGSDIQTTLSSIVYYKTGKVALFLNFPDQLILKTWQRLSLFTLGQRKTWEHLQYPFFWLKTMKSIGRRDLGHKIVFFHPLILPFRGFRSNLVGPMSDLSATLTVMAD